MRWSALLTGVLVFDVTRPVSAQADASSKAAAEALFTTARSLAAAGKYSEACPKFEASEKLDPGVGTMLNLADCYDKLGRTASAWAQYREAIGRAHTTHATEREDLARERAQEITGRLSTLTLRTTQNEACPALVLSRDGAPLDGAELGIAIPVDPGKHQLSAAAPGCKSWSAEVVVGPGPAKVTVDVPALEVAPPTAETTAVPQTQPDSQPKAGAALVVEPPPVEKPQPAAKPSGLRPIAVGVGAAGLVGVGIGVFFGVSASANWRDAKGGCQNGHTECSEDALTKRSRALSDATVSTVAFIVGGAAVATGAVLWFTAPGAGGTTVAVGPGSIFARGRF